jgi:hypothetical protein
MRNRANRAGGGRALTLALLFLVAGAVGGSLLDLSPAEAAVRSANPAGYRTVVVTNAGFRLTIPDTWIDFDFTQPSTPARYRAFRRRHVHAVTLPPNPTSAFRGLQFYTGDPVSPSEVLVSLAARVKTLPTIPQLLANAARLDPQFRPEIQTLDIDHHQAIRTINPCVISPPNAPGVTCAGSESIMVLGRHGLLTFSVDPGFDGPEANATSQVVSSISLL